MGMSRIQDINNRNGDLKEKRIGGVYGTVKVMRKDIFDNKSRFEDNSQIDQDDSYGSYRPAFLVKKHKVLGRTEDIMKLQRMASMDKVNALLGPIQPDLSGKKPENKRMYADNYSYK